MMKTSSDYATSTSRYVAQLATLAILLCTSLVRFTVAQVRQALPWSFGKRRSGITAIVEISVGLILFATLGFAALTILQTSSTAGWSTTVAVVAVTVTGVLAAISVALSFYHYAKNAF